MPAASRAQTSFLGGIWSGAAQGRFDDPAYATALTVCLNGILLETGAWTRRPGTQFAQTTRNGAAGRVLKYDFNGAAPYTVELTAATARFRNGPNLATTNDSVTIAAISSANPAVVQTSSAVTWITGNQAFFSGLGTPDGRLSDRIVSLTKVDTTHFSITDAITGANIDGSTLAAFTTGTINRIQEVTTPYISNSWANVRMVQGDGFAALLHGAIAPQILTPTNQPNAPIPGNFAQFTLAQAAFNDGPYLDPFVNGVQATPGATKGIVQFTLAFPAYDSGTAYAKGAFVTSSSVNYVSLQDQNVGNTPVSSPSFWATTSAQAAINGGQGLLGGDIGRLVRFLSEPAAWAVGTTYAANNVVSYNPTAKPGATTYWSSLVGSNVGNVPGTDLKNWTLITNPPPSVWTWGKITSLLSQISQSLSGSVNIGTMTGNGGVNASFDGTISKTFSGCSEFGVTGAAGGNTDMDAYVGKNYSGASAQAIASATIYPPSDVGLVQCYVSEIPGNENVIGTVTVSLRASAGAPGFAGDGQLLGSVSFSNKDPQNTAPVNITSSDTVSTWNYVWIELKAHNPGFSTDTPQLRGAISQVQFFNPPGSGVSNGFNAEILGPALLYTTPIITWRMGVYSGTTGFPTCGTWQGGRLWLGGAIPNRFDASVVNGVTGSTIDFTPTARDGTVAASNSLSYVLNAPDVNQILWFSPEDRGIVCGTQSGEFLIFASANNNIISPLSIDSRRITRNGCANIEPRRAENTLLVVQKHQRKLLEYFTDVFSGKYSAPNLSKNAKALTQTGIQEIAYQQELAPILWARRGDGTLIGCTYKRDSLMSSQGPTFAGWHQHTLGSGRTVQSICDAGSVDGTLDSLAMVTLDPATGIYHVEIMTNIFEEGTAITAAWFLDDAVNPSTYVLNRQTQQITLYGLWHLNGKQVDVWINGLDAGNGYTNTSGTFVPYTVTNGSLVVPVDGTANVLLTDAAIAPTVGAATLQVVVGFSFTSQGQPLRVAEQKGTGAATGPAFGHMARTQQIAALLQDTQGISFGSVFTGKLRTANFKQADGNTALSVSTLFTGVYWDAVECGYTRDKPHICWQITRPFPATLSAISGFMETQG